MGKTKQKGNAVMRKITELKEKQEIALGILLYLDEVCRKHHLIYFAADGTLLGLIRHQGFIPWDDNVDVWMLCLLPPWPKNRKWIRFWKVS